MAKPILYLFVGPPGAGKTTVAQIINKTAGAVHLWADAERHKLFANPTHELSESTALYKMLNGQTADLLRDGTSVVFDTNFNHFTDRQKLRDIADKAGAETILIWMITPLDTAKKRALDALNIRNGYKNSMSEQQFTDIIAKFEAPTEHEKAIKINGTKLDEASIRQLLQL